MIALSGFSKFLQYFLGALLGATISSALLALATRDPFFIFLVAIIIGIPVGLVLGLLAVYRARETGQTRKSRIALIAVIYYAGGLAGMFAGGAAAVFLADLLDPRHTGLNWLMALLGMASGGVLGNRFVKYLVKKKFHYRAA